MLQFLGKANRIERSLYREHVEHRDSADKGHDFTDGADDWLDEVWDVAEKIGLYGSERTTAAASRVAEALQALGPPRPMSR